MTGYTPLLESDINVSYTVFFLVVFSYSVHAVTTFAGKCSTII